MLDEWRILTAAALCGVTAGALAIGVAYVLERQQFGRPIGSYQSIQHGLADIPAFIDGSRMLAHKAAWALDSGLRGAPGGREVAGAPSGAMSTTVRSPTRRCSP